MNLSVHPYFLEFIRPFALAHGTRNGTQLAFVRIEHDGIFAYGEASLPPYLPETFDSVKTWVSGQFDPTSELLEKDPFDHNEVIPFSADHPAASCALQSALLHWHIAARGGRLSDHFEQRDARPALPLTITISDFKFLDEKLKLAKNFTHLKLKLTGQADDLEFARAVRNKTALPFCVDINQGFQKKEDAIQLIEKVEPLNCVLVEQPLNATDHDGHYWLKQRVPLSIIADESIRQYEDLVQFHEAYSGVNIKLMKSGGLFQARRMLQFEACGPEFMQLIGCMSESSLGVATASVLAAQCEMADLDAPYLCKNDPFTGFRIENGRIEVADRIRLKKGMLNGPHG